MKENDKFEDEYNLEQSSEESKSPPPKDPLTPAPSFLDSDQAKTPPLTEETLGEVEEVKEPTRFQLFMRKALTWLAVVAVSFLGGFITFYFTLYQPKVDLLTQTETALAESEQEVTDLNTQLKIVTTSRDSLQNAADHQALSSIMTDTYAARLALTEEDTARAKSFLSGTKETLDEIIDVIGDFDSKLAETLPQRLSLIKTNIDRNIDNAIADCDLLISDLREVEHALYP